MRISDWSSDVCSSDLEARERVDQADVRTFRGFNRADAAIMGGVNVAHFKARAFTGKTARPERRHTTLVRDFGQRIGLIHELGKLRGAEELAHGSNSGLRVNEVVGHDCRNVDARHALLNRTDRKSTRLNYRP